MSKLENLPKATITERRDLSDDLMVIKIETPEPFTFKAGQYITIGLDNVERPYSIASSPREPFVELFVELVPRGSLTPKLWKLKPGDLVSYRPLAKGGFTFDGSCSHHLMVSTVTGVVPYVSMLRQMLYHGVNGHKFYILQGARYHDELAYDRELAAMSAGNPDKIIYIPTISGPGDPRNAGWEGAVGRVNAIAEDWTTRWGLDPIKDRVLVYACGNPGMIEDVKARFQPKGWKIKVERFWKD